MLRRIIYATGFYTLGRPIGEYAMHRYNNYWREEQDGVSNEKRLRQTYKGKWAVVTGASEGIGKAYAMDLARAGYSVLLASRSQEKLNKVRDEILLRDPNAEVLVVPIDLASAKDYSPIVGAKGVMGNLGILINNAGQLVDGHFFGLDPWKLQTENQLNMNAITVMTKYAINTKRQLG